MYSVKFEWCNSFKEGNEIFVKHAKSLEHLTSSAQRFRREMRLYTRQNNSGVQAVLRKTGDQRW